MKEIIENIEKLSSVLFSVEGDLKGSIIDFYIYFSESDSLDEKYNRLNSCYETYKHKIKYNKDKIENILNKMKIVLYERNN